VGIAVFAAYYLGARLGLALTFQPLPISVLWPPNAILFAALLLVPFRTWPIVAAAALPAHLLSELQGGIPLSMAVCWFVSNMTEAAMGAAIVHLLVGASRPFEKMRGVMLFVLAAIVSATFSSFLDAAFVRLNGFGTSTYWEVWSSRLFSNVTADLVIVPTVVALAGLGIAGLRREARGRAIEATLLVAGLIVVSVFALDTQLARNLPPALVCLPLPFMLWAACRFGPSGAACAITFVALVAIVGAGHGVGAFGARAPIENAYSVQLFLLCIGPTLLGLAAAVHERETGDESVRVSDKRFQLVLEATQDAVYDRDLATGAMWWSQGGPGRFAYARRDDLVEYAAFADAMHPDDRDRALDAQRDAVRGGHPHWEVEFRIRRGDGRYAHVHEQGFIVRDSAGNTLRMIGALADVTERRDAEELGQRLAHASRLTAMGELTASIAHEINQPMSAILSNVDAAEMLLDSDRLDPVELRAILTDIRNDDLRAAEVIRHMRGLASKRQVEFEVFDAVELIAAVLRIVAPAARRRQVAIEWDCGTLPQVRGDRIYLQQVLLNLLFNAMDSMDGTVAERRRLEVGAWAVGAGMVEIKVRDHGHGIPEGREEKLFERFYTTKGDGLGLGLPIARSLVQAHGGRIWAENEPDEGATFRFTVPAA
jgi:PAS domain S-box-containing protein